MTISGTLYRPGCVLAIGSKKDEPVFRTVDSIYVCGNDVFFCVAVAKLIEYDNHFHCYVLQHSSIKKYVHQKDLLDHLASS